MLKEGHQPNMADNLHANYNHAPNNNIINQPQPWNGFPPAQRLWELHMPTIATNLSCIWLSNVARNYVIKNFHLHILLTFNGLGTKDALGFLREFHTIIQLFPLNGLSVEELRLIFFPYCLKGDAKQGLLGLSKNFIGSWDEVYLAFMFKYYPSQKTIDYKGIINLFT